MSAQNDTLYLKIDQNIMVKDRHVTLSDVAKLSSTNKAMLRQVKQMKIYSFPDKPKNKKEFIQVISILKIIDMIQETYPNTDIVNLGEKDFVLEYEAAVTPPKSLQIMKTILLCIIIFFGAAFTIMAFNNDISITDVFSKLYMQVIGRESSGVTELEICYCIGLPIGVILFFNHFGNAKITNDPTPIQVEMRKYEKDVDETFIENSSRGGKEIDVD